MVAVPSPSPLPLVDRLVPGGIEKFLTDARSKGQSLRVIADRLKTEHDIDVTPPTVDKWCRGYKIEKAEA
jgi:hypothetical protein